MYKEEKYLVIIWSILIGITLLSWEAGSANISTTPTWLLVSILLLTFIKVRFVILDFMEIRDAPTRLRIVLDVWLALTCLAIMAGFLLL